MVDKNDAASEIKETLENIANTKKAKKDAFYGAAIVASVIAVSIIVRDPRYSLAVAVTGAVDFWLYRKGRI